MKQTELEIQIRIFNDCMQYVDEVFEHDNNGCSYYVGEIHAGSKYWDAEGKLTDVPESYYGLWRMNDSDDLIDESFEYCLINYDWKKCKAVQVTYTTYR